MNLLTPIHAPLAHILAVVVLAAGCGGSQTDRPAPVEIAAGGGGSGSGTGGSGGGTGGAGGWTCDPFGDYAGANPADCPARGIDQPRPLSPCANEGLPCTYYRMAGACHYGGVDYLQCCHGLWMDSWSHVTACGDAGSAGADGGTDADLSDVNHDATDADAGPAGEWLDDAGVCRSSQIPSFRTCPATFQAAVDGGAPVGMVRSGSCGTMLVWISDATPSIGCGYDSTGATLVARYFGDDVRDHCGDASYGVSTPNWPASCVPVPVDAATDAR